MGLRNNDDGTANPEHPQRRSHRQPRVSGQRRRQTTIRSLTPPPTSQRNKNGRSLTPPPNSPRNRLNGAVSLSPSGPNRRRVPVQRGTEKRNFEAPLHDDHSKNKKNGNLDHRLGRKTSTNTSPAIDASERTNESMSYSRASGGSHNSRSPKRGQRVGSEGASMDCEGSTIGRNDLRGTKQTLVEEKLRDDSDSEFDSDPDDDDDYLVRAETGGNSQQGNSNGSSSLGPSNLKTTEVRKRDRTSFPDDKWWQKCLRYFRILAPVPKESRTRRIVRRLIWATLVLDILVAIVSIATFGGTVTMCCNQATMASGIPKLDWNLLTQIMASLYLAGIVLEIHPVVREGPIPWNLLNPIFGSLLGFAVFVDDSKAEAISIWIMEFTSIVLELITYQKLKELFQREGRRLQKLDGKLKGSCKGEYKKNAYLRERRIMRIEHAENMKTLRYHLVGVSVNFVLVGLTLLLMILVARGGGMCLVEGDGGGLKLFHPDQRSRCSLCEEESNGWKDPCEICKENEDPIQCFYPYF